MDTKTTPTGRNREATEQRLLDAIGEMIAQDGFEQIGINAVAKQSGVSKILIYRYFDSVDGLMAAYIRRNDFWINFSIDKPADTDLATYLTGILRQQVHILRHNHTLRRLYRWELSSKNDFIVALREQRETAGLKLIDKVAQLSGLPHHQVASLATVFTASITYLVMLEEFCPVYNGIAINQDQGWDLFLEGIEMQIRKVLS